MADKLNDVIKACERDHEIKVAYDDFLLIRIDGHKFSKFTKKFKKPYDSILSNAMEKTSQDLVSRFGATTAYTQSDEITLVFPPVFREDNGEITNNQVFGGRTQKIASLVAAYTTMRFNFWLTDEFNTVEFNDDDYEEMIRGKLGTAHFDARVFGVPTKEDACNVFIWRYRDAIKNSKSMFAQAYCSHKSLLNKNGREQVEFCLETTGNDWNNVEDRFKYGIFVKKEQYMKPVVDENNVETGDFVERSRIASYSVHNFNFQEENVDLVIRKYI